jgi:hypothetical protein
MKKNLLLINFIFLLVSIVAAQNDNFYYQNAVYNENIKTVLMYREGFELSNPVLTLNEDVALVFKFDDLSGEVKNYYYTIIHCDVNWNESFLIQEDYLNGYAENQINDYGLSFNTTFKYVNYRLNLPNEDVQFKISGNYALLVYEDADKEKIVISQRFYVVEPQVEIVGTVRRATLDAFKGENQEVDFSVYHKNLEIINARDEVKVVLMQNNRWDNAIRNLKPLYIKKDELVYDYNSENVFEAGNEFRYFDIRTNRIPGENVLSTDFFRPYYHKTLMQGEVRADKKFFSYEEMNGKYVVESQDPQVQDFDTECDYLFTHFGLKLESILLGGSVNVFGALTGWNANKGNEMTWNFDTNQYELTLLLKQGYYNFQYVYVEQGATVADAKNIEGSFWETENDYQIFVYYKNSASRFYRLVGYRILNSVKNRTK